VIRGYTVEVDPDALGKPLTAFIRLTAAYDDRHAAGVEAIAADPDVLECYSVAGEDCFIIKTRVDSPGALEALIHRIRARMTVLRSVTMIALSAIKEGGPLTASAPEPTALPAATTLVTESNGNGRSRRAVKI
jgi:Lrp/AsnC family leucine-responsive transcriptional regulator